MISERSLMSTLMQFTIVGIVHINLQALLTIVNNIAFDTEILNKSYYVLCSEIIKILIFFNNFMQIKIIAVLLFFLLILLLMLFMVPKI